jgi:hypothetical protein
MNLEVAMYFLCVLHINPFSFAFFLSNTISHLIPSNWTIKWFNKKNKQQKDNLEGKKRRRWKLKEKEEKLSSLFISTMKLHKEGQIF